MWRALEVGVEVSGHLEFEVVLVVSVEVVVVEVMEIVGRKKRIGNSSFA